MDLSGPERRLLGEAMQTTPESARVGLWLAVFAAAMVGIAFLLALIGPHEPGELRKVIAGFLPMIGFNLLLVSYMQQRVIRISLLRKISDNE